MLEAKLNDYDAVEQFEFMKALSEKMPESIMITTTEEHGGKPEILHVNSGFTRLTGYGPRDVLGKTPRLLQGKRTDRRVLERLKKDLSTKERFRGRTYNYRKNGESFLMDWEILPFHTSLGMKSFYLTIQREVTS